MRILSILTPWAVAHETFTSEHLVIITNVLVVMASLILAWATIRAASRERQQERSFLLKMLRLIVRANTDAAHRKDV